MKFFFTHILLAAGSLDFLAGILTRILYLQKKNFKWNFNCFCSSYLESLPEKSYYVVS
ncbi:hypothetical protein [uncultured Clostridium sp.]|uniref:hypothetical protein n=1 Tax=uncultured Clostridium sp. TaxID=59620 RepID=UPI0026304ED7|nr:hypothetical protein [uncultured Clostridium sp.]